MNLLSLNTLPNTGEAVKNYGAYIGIIVIIAIIFVNIITKESLLVLLFFIIKRYKRKFNFHIILSIFII